MQVLIRMSHVPQRFIYPVEIDRPNSTGLKNTFKRPKKQKLSLIWLHTGTMVCCTSSNQNFTRATMISLPGRIRPASKTPLKRPKKQKLSLIWLHTGTMVCFTSSNQNVARATTIYLPGQNRPVEFDRPQKHL